MIGCLGLLSRYTKLTRPARTTLRLVIMGITKRPVLSPAIPRREYDLSSLPSSFLSSSPSSSSRPKSLPSSTNVASLPSATTRPVVTALAPHAPLRSHLLPLTPALPESHLPDPLTLLPPMETTSAWTSEMIESSVTLIHVLLLIRASVRSNSFCLAARLCPTRHGVKLIFEKQSQYRPSSLSTLSSRIAPFAIPLFLSLLARSLRQPLQGTEHDSALLADQYAQIDRRMALTALLTGPMWVGWTRPKVLRVVKGLERIPVVGLVGEFVEGYLPLVDDYFYCE